MTIWVDANVSPVVARWLRDNFPDIEAISLWKLQRLGQDDRSLFEAARELGAVVLTKDADFLHLVRQQGAPPQVILLRCGNLSNAELLQLLSVRMPAVLAELRAGRDCVEIGV